MLVFKTNASFFFKFNKQGNGIRSFFKFLQNCNVFVGLIGIE